MEQRVLGVFAKEPRAGRVKTRLASAVSAEWAASVAATFLRDTLARTSSVGTRRVLCFAPRPSHDYFASLAGPEFALIPQGDGDLGCRMAIFFADQFLAGAEKIVLIGSDSPTLPVAFIEQAFAALENVDVVLGPATDGGYYLVGCRRDVRTIFEAIPWGSSQVLSATVPAIERAGYRLHLLPPWYDVDTLDDWWMLQGHVAAMRQAGIDPGIPNTEQLLHAPVT